jgi:hypothetical protein
MRLTEVELSYLAGIFDGEGCLTISWDSRNKKGHGSALLQVTNTSDLPFWLCEEVGLGNVYTRNQNERWATAYIWKIGSHAEIRMLLPQLLPYLRIKQRQGILMMLFLQLPRGINGEGLSEETRTASQWITRQIQELNRRGPKNKI